MTAIATAPARTPRAAGRGAPRPTPRSGSTVARPARVERPLKVVEAPKRRYPALAVAAVAVFLVFGSMLASATVHSMLVTGQVRIDELSRKIGAAEKGLAHDRLELAQLSSPERIAAEAEKLGLVVADQQTWIRPGSGRAPVVTGAGSDIDEVDPAAQVGDVSGSSETGDERALAAGAGEATR